MPGLRTQCATLSRKRTPRLMYNSANRRVNMVQPDENKPSRRKIYEQHGVAIVQRRRLMQQKKGDKSYLKILESAIREEVWSCL